MCHLHPAIQQQRHRPYLVPSLQFDACRSFLEAHKDNAWMWIGERFDDESWYGATLDRLAFRRLLAKLRNGGLDRVLVYRLDRLSRNVVVSVALLKELRERGINLAIVNSPETGSTAHRPRRQSPFLQPRPTGESRVGHPRPVQRILGRSGAPVRTVSS